MWGRVRRRMENHGEQKADSAASAAERKRSPPTHTHAHQPPTRPILTVAAICVIE